MIRESRGWLAMKKTMVFGALKSQKGSSSFIIVCMAIIVILASALAADIGIAAVERYSLARNAEMTARTGMVLVAKEKGLSGEREENVRMARSYGVGRVGDLTELDVKVSDDGREISVAMERPFEFNFLKLAGYKGKPLKAEVTARLSGISSYKGIRPFAVESRNIALGKPCVLSDSPADNSGETGYTALNLGNGNFRPGILYGYWRTLKIGEGVYGLSRIPGEDTKEALDELTGKCSHKPQCTYDKYSEDCPRIMILPVVNKMDPTGKSAMEVAGFAGFFVEESAVRDGHVFIKGRFIRHIINSQTSDDAADFGLAGVKILR